MGHDPGKDPAGDAETMDPVRYQMILAGMMEELGPGRLDALPLEDKGWDAFDAVVPTQPVGKSAKANSSANPWNGAFSSLLTKLT